MRVVLALLSLGMYNFCASQDSNGSKALLLLCVLFRQIQSEPPKTVLEP